MSLVVPGEEDEAEEIGALGRIYRVKSRPAPLNPQYRAMSPSAYLSRDARLRKILRVERPDLVEVCDKYTLNYFAGMLRCGMMGDVGCRPLVVGLSCERMDDNVRAYMGWNAVSPYLVHFYMKWLYFSLFDHHIANSYYTADELRPVSIGHPIGRGVWVRPMGVDFRGLSPRLRSASTRQSLLDRISAPDNAVLLLYVGRLVPEKNLDLLIDTVAVLGNQREWRLILVGDGMGRDKLLSEAAHLVPGRVHRLGHMRDREELARIYSNCDVFLHPNPREPFGIAPLEAMASGLPVVVPNRGGVLFYANNSNAWIVPPTGRAFAQAVHDVMSDCTSRERRISNAVATAEAFRWEKVADSFLDLYEDLLSSQAGRSSQFRPEFVSTFPQKPPVLARLTAGVFQRLLATR